MACMVLKAQHIVHWIASGQRAVEKCFVTRRGTILLTVFAQCEAVLCKVVHIAFFDVDVKSSERTSWGAGSRRSLRAACSFGCTYRAPNCRMPDHASPHVGSDRVSSALTRSLKFRFLLLSESERWPAWAVSWSSLAVCWRAAISRLAPFVHHAMVHEYFKNNSFNFNLF